MEKLKEVCDLKHKVIDQIKCAIDEEGIKNINTYELGQAVDMVKDLAKAEKDCLEACYYDTVIDAMEGYDYRSGYDNWRYSSGRFAPKGRGHYAGYTPDGRMPIYMDEMMRNERMGYPNDDQWMQDYYRTGYPSTTKSQTGRTSTYRTGYPAYMDYQNARRYYHETGDPHAREEMDHKSKEHMEEISETIHEMWDDASPEQKKQLKGHISKLLAELAI